MPSPAGEAFSLGRKVRHTRRAPEGRLRGLLWHMLEPDKPAITFANSIFHTALWDAILEYPPHTRCY